MIKETKDKAKSVRISTEATKDLKKKGYSVQKALDFAIEIIRARPKK